MSGPPSTSINIQRPRLLSSPTNEHSTLLHKCTLEYCIICIQILIQSGHTSRCSYYVKRVCIIIYRYVQICTVNCIIDMTYGVWWAIAVMDPWAMPEQLGRGSPGNISATPCPFQSASRAPFLLLNTALQLTTHYPL